jgi:hypothetical protein
MSQRKKTAPPTPVHPRSSPAGRKGLIAKERTKKQSAKRRTVLDNRFHRTDRSSPAWSRTEECTALGTQQVAAPSPVQRRVRQR